MNHVLSLPSGAAIGPLLLIDVAFKSSLMLLATLIAASVMRKRPAAMQHGVWTAGLVACLAIPIVALAAPTWNLPFLPKSLVDRVTFGAQSTLQSPSPRGIDSKQSVGLGATAILLIAPETAGRGTQQPFGENVSNACESHRAPSAAAGQPSWLVAGISLWVAGTILCLIRTAYQTISLRKMLRRCRDLHNADWQRDVADASRTLAFTREVRLRVHDDAVIPVVAGIRRTILVLPYDAEAWPPARRRLVLLHELAHAKRRDALTQTIAAMTSALYWFNPIVWRGRAQMQQLRELACDDMVIASGQRPVDYAAMLLDVAKSYRHRSLATAIGMARESNVENRITAILDNARGRAAMSRRLAGALTATAVALTLVVGSMRLQAHADEPSTPSIAAAQAVPAAGGTQSSNESELPPPYTATLKTIETDYAAHEYVLAAIGVLKKAIDKAFKELPDNVHGEINRSLDNRLTALLAQARSRHTKDYRTSELALRLLELAYDVTTLHYLPMGETPELRQQASRQYADLLAYAKQQLEQCGDAIEDAVAQHIVQAFEYALQPIQSDATVPGYGAPISEKQYALLIAIIDSNLAEAVEFSASRQREGVTPPGPHDAFRLVSKGSSRLREAIELRSQVELMRVAVMKELHEWAMETDSLRNAIFEQMQKDEQQEIAAIIQRTRDEAQAIAERTNALRNKLP